MEERQKMQTGNLKIKNTLSGFFIIFVIFTLLISSSAGCRKTETLMDTFSVSRGDIITDITTTGTVDTVETKNFSMMQSAEVTKSLKKGDTFKKGDILISIDNSKVEYYASQAEQNLILAEQAIKVAKINYQSALNANHVAIQIAESSNNLAEQQTLYAFKALDNASSLGIANIEAANQSIENAEYYLKKAKDSAISTDLVVAQAKTNADTAEKAYEQAKKSAKSQSDSAEGAYMQSLSNQSITYWNNINSLEIAAAQIKLMAANITQAETQLEISKINFELAKLDLDDFSIIAPFDGIVQEVNFSEGEIISPQVPAVSIISNEFIIKSDINEADILKLKTGQKAEFVLDAYPEETFTGEVTEISPISKNIAGIILFEISIKPDKEAEEFLKYGFSANITINLAKLENVLYVPIQAVYEEENKSFVDVLGENNEIVKTEVRIGSSNYDYIEIKSGVSEGDIIVLSE